MEMRLTDQYSKLTARIWARPKRIAFLVREDLRPDLVLTAGSSRGAHDQSAGALQNID